MRQMKVLAQSSIATPVIAALGIFLFLTKRGDGTKKQDNTYYNYPE